MEWYNVFFLFVFLFAITIGSYFIARYISCRKVCKDDACKGAKSCEYECTMKSMNYQCPKAN